MWLWGGFLIAKVIHRRLSTTSDLEIQMAIKKYVEKYPDDFMRIVTLVSDMTTAYTDTEVIRNGK